MRKVLAPPATDAAVNNLMPGGWWRESDDGARLICDLCPRECSLKPGDRGFCFVRQNIDGEMFLTTWGRSTGFCIDPTEKKPLNHFYPGTSVLSFGTAGCNLGCKFCQNWDICPLYSFHRPGNFANGTPIFEEISATLDGQSTANNTKFRTSELAFFVQDDWKFRPNLTLNLGLRWTYMSPVTASDGVLGNLALGPTNGLAGARIVTNKQLHGRDLNNWGPQLGFAWNPKMFDNKLVIRGGGGMGYDRLANALLANARRNPPNGALFGICCGTAGTPGEDWGSPFVGGLITFVRRTALTKPNSVLLTEKAAARLFGGENPLGRSLLLAGNELFEVTGILKDHPRHSHLHFEMIVSYATLEKSAHLQRTSEDWEDFSGSYLYVLLEKPDRREPVETHLERLARNVYKDQTIKAAFSLQSLNDIVPGPDLRNGAGPSSDLLSMGIFFFLTLLILLPACANYATLSISRGLKRMKEIGVRKAIGGRKDQIVTQFAIVRRSS